MPTTIDSMTGVTISSSFFNNSISLELFPTHPKVLKNPNAPNKNRVALIYGPNGSGKSTIAQGFREYVECTSPRTVTLYPVAGASILKISPGMKAEKFFVFDESYIAQNIKVQKDGLGTIVLLGQQVQLEQRLEELSREITQVQSNIDKQSETCRNYSVSSNVVSPQYWIATITKTLQSTNGWAEIGGIRIRGHQIKTRVTEGEINRLGKLTPNRDDAATRAEFTQQLAIFDSTNSTTDPIEPAISPLDIPEDIVDCAKMLLMETPQKPILSPREQELLEAMGINTISTAKGFLSVSSHKVCPTCLQPISEKYRVDVLEKIEHILNREVQEFSSKLQDLFLTELPQDSYLKYKIIDLELLDQINQQVVLVNSLIHNRNGAIQAKLSDPLSVMEYDDTTGLLDAYRVLNNLLADLEGKRVAFNKVIADRKTIESVLLNLNDEIGHYAIVGDYQALLSQREAQRNDAEKLKALQDRLEKLRIEQQMLDAKRKNFQIAVDQINKSLSYIFYSNHRLELHLEDDQLYHLKSNGQPVSPDKISCGERNALALCYFFTEIAKETELRNLYEDEMFLVVDDPVSSFDIENRVGILSFLRYKLSQLLSACTTTKILLMTHDVSVLFDLQKAMEEISSNCASCGKNAEYTLFQLQNKELKTFPYRTHNEYTRLMQCVYEYGCNPTEDQELTIGNITRRVLEAFSTFTFKEGVEKVSLNPAILSLIPDQQKREYFQNSMYRLVLNTESHFQKAIQGAPEASFYSHLSIAEKQRTARDILSFMYEINPVHVLSHLPGAKNDIETWLSNIS